MVFSNLVFLFVFLPVVLILYYLLPKQLKNFVLLLASLFFYAWGEPKYVVLMMVEYSGVFTGDHREINIINPFKTEEGTKVLFIKDSYANPLTLWLAQHFYQTTFYDLRYNTDRTLYQYLEQNDYDMIAFLYNDLTIFPGMYEFD